MTPRSQRVSVGMPVLTAIAALVTACSSSTSPGTASSGGPVPLGGSTSAAHTVYPLTITQPDGTTAVIKQRPTRVVTVNNPSYAVEYLTALGAQPIGGATYPPASGGVLEYDSRGVPLVVSSQVKSFTSVGIVAETPDLEKIVGLHPDLIVGDDPKAQCQL